MLRFTFKGIDFSLAEIVIAFIGGFIGLIIAAKPGFGQLAMLLCGSLGGILLAGYISGKPMPTQQQMLPLLKQILPYWMCINFLVLIVAIVGVLLGVY